MAAFEAAKKNKTWRLGEFKGKKIVMSTEKNLGWDFNQARTGDFAERNDDDASIEHGKKKLQISPSNHCGFSIGFVSKWTSLKCIKQLY